MSSERTELLQYVELIRKNQAVTTKEERLYGKYKNAYKKLLDDTKQALLRCLFMEYNGSLYAEEEEFAALESVCETINRPIVKAMVIYHDEELINMIIEDGHRMYSRIIEKGERI